MNHSVLRPFAQTARRELRKQVELRLDYVLKTDSAELRQRALQVKALNEALAAEGREALVERVAYTWFNRIVALRFMDANGYHPFGARVITAASAQETLPELLQQARAGVLDADLRAQLDTAETFEGILSGSIPAPSREGTAYRMLLVAACHYYHGLMPFLFEKLGDATELLLPEDLLTEHSVVHSFRSDLTDADCHDVEVIGWLYQYYISEKKDQVMARKSAVPTEDIPAVTQLFTPHWIVRYLVENSLGRLWLLNRPSSKLRTQMPYYIEGEPETNFLKITKPEEIKLLDPAGGSGHMLTYAYDLLYAIYEEEGYDAPEIPGLILKHNLHGIDICDRAAALAAFALVMKARGSDSRFFRRAIQPQVIGLQDVRFKDGELSAYYKALGVQPSALHSNLNRLLHEFEEAKNFGALIQPCLSEAEIRAVRSLISNRESAIATDDLLVATTHLEVLRALEQAEFLTPRYHVVVANPPYMGSGNMNATLKAFVANTYPEAKVDLFSVFIQQVTLLAMKGAYAGLVTMQSWMFLSKLEAFRANLLRQNNLLCMAHLGPRAFDSIAGEVVQTTAFVFGAQINSNAKAVFHSLLEGRTSTEKSEMLLRRVNEFRLNPRECEQISGWPLAYWSSPTIRKIFKDLPPLESLASPRQGLATSDNGQFIRLWYELERERIGYGFESRAAAQASNIKWFPINKGGSYRKWYGNNDYVVNWEHDGQAIKLSITTKYPYLKGNPDFVAKNPTLYFKPGITWSAVSSSDLAVRFDAVGFIPSNAGMKVFHDDPDKLVTIGGFLNSVLIPKMIGCLSQTLNFDQGLIARLPYKPVVEVRNAVESAITIARADWDNFETSWDFRDQPLLRQGLKSAKLEASWRNWEAQSNAAIRRMQELETENNRLFITAYGLDGELSPEVPEEQITLARPDRAKDISAFLSYAIGCMMGRYSLDLPGLILADAGATVSDYLAKVPAPTFAPDTDGILPFIDGEWFKDDVVARTREFLRVTFGDETLAENIAFIEASLGKDLRKYYTKDFYKNHISGERAYGYKKRPIYWMVSSPEGSFQALIYLHRYTRDTVNLLLNNYVREFLHKLEARQQELTSVTLNDSARPAEKTKATKELSKIEKMLKEIRAWERDVVLPLAQKRIELDLDDGVKVNYQKFPGLLVPIPGLEKKEEE